MSKIGGLKDKAKDAGQIVINSAANAPNKVANNAKNAAENAKKGLKDKSKYLNKDSKLAKTRDSIKKDMNDFEKDPLRTTGRVALNGAKGIGGKALKFGNDVIQKQRELRRIVNTTKNIAVKLMPYTKIIGIACVVVLLIYNAIIFGISVGQSVETSPHFYCDVDAPLAIKHSAVYQQYCTQKDLNWNVENINGHYIVQDGKGPADCCAIANMLLRFYTIKSGDLWFGTTNVYSYLWQSDGQYNIRGTTFALDDPDAGAIASSYTIRSMLTGYNDAINYEENDPDIKVGSREFAAMQEKPDFTMSNWGYLRDENIDIKSYKQTSDFYLADDENTNWVWDLSVENQAPGSAWRNPDKSWEMSFRLNGTKFAIEEMKCPNGDKGYAILKDRIVNVLNATYGDWTEYYKGTAGVLLQYSKTTSTDTIKHTILLTKYKKDSAGNMTWYGVDSSLGVCGGWEGPLNDSEERFVNDGIRIAELLDSNKQSYEASDGSIYQVEKIGYCIKPRFGFF